MKSLLKKTVPLFAAASIGLTAQAAPLAVLGDNVELFALGSVALEYQDNLFKRSTNEVSDIAFKVSPGLEVVFGQSPAASAKLTYKHHFYFYDDEGDLDDDYADLAFTSRYDTGLFIGKFDASYREVASNTADANLNGMLVHRDLTKVAVEGKYQVTELIAFSAGIEFDKTDYKSSLLTDTESFSVPVTLFYKIRPAVDLTAGYRYRTTDWENSFFSFAGDYDDNLFFIGAVGELGSPKLIGDVRIGWQERDFNNTDGKDDSFNYSARVTYAATASTSFFAVMSNDYRTSSSSLNNNRGLSYNYGIATVGGNFSLTEAIKADASVSYGQAGYKRIDREEDHIFFDVGLSYSPNDYLSVRAAYGYEDIDGKGTGASDYTNNRISVTASIRY